MFSGERIHDSLKMEKNSALGATRIGHAVRILEDPDLVNYIRDHRIGIETNLTSNVHTITVTSYQAHPLKTFLDLGLFATINTDDPGISPVTLADEFENAVKHAGLTNEDTRIAQENALKIAFLGDYEKASLLNM